MHIHGGTPFIRTTFMRTDVDTMPDLANMFLNFYYSIPGHVI